MTRPRPQPELPWQWNQHLVASDGPTETQQVEILLNVTIFRNSPPVTKNITLVMVEVCDVIVA